MGKEGRSASLATFDLVPSWWKKPHAEKKYSSFNAKSETVSELKTFNSAWQNNQRAILPAHGFFEWPQPKQKGSAPFFITHADGGRLQLAALWSRWINPETDQPEETFCILTTTPNADMKTVPHHRSPVVLSENQIDIWFNAPPADALSLLRPPSDGTFQFVRVSSYVNTIGHEGPECVAAQASLF